MEKFDILNILRSNKTIFTFKDILLLSKDRNPALLSRRLNYYVKKGELYSIRKGIYAKDKNYSKLELATRIFTPAYISFETVLGKAGIIFQYYGQIFCASYLTREIIINNQVYSFKKIKNEILLNKAGIEFKDNYYIACPERALLDVLYLNKDYYFDNLLNIDWNKIYKILLIYGGNERMRQKLKKLQEEAKK